MSHQPERKEKDCLNCGATVIGHYCHVCGQENTVPKQHFWSLTKHFVYDIFHFDGKFFSTLKYLFLKPGSVPKEYASGKRQRYLDPIRMYLFTSAFFFLVFFKFWGPQHINPIHVEESKPLSTTERARETEDLQKKLARDPADSESYKKIQLLKDTSKPVTESELFRQETVTIGNHRYRNLSEYDSAQRHLPSTERDSWISKKFNRKLLTIKEKYRGDTREASNIIFETFLHRFPYLLFLSLPFFALILKFLYRRKKELYYSDHAAFTLYHYIFSFILLLLIFVFRSSREWSHWQLFNWIIFGAVLYGAFYLHRSMRVFYQESRGKTTAKLFVLGFLGVMTLLVLFLVFILFSFFEL